MNSLIKKITIWMNNHILLSILLIFIFGIITGKWVLHKPEDRSTIDSSTDKTVESASPQVWTCSMHPQIRQDEFGLCPICAMELVLVEVGSGNESPYQIAMSEAAMKIAEVQTTIVEQMKPFKEILFQGKVKADERMILSQTAHIPGRIEKLYISYTGAKVHKGEKLIAIYSPELITAQEELFEALKHKDTYPALLNSAKKKLKLWKLTDKQIAGIENSGKVMTEFDLVADYDGIVTKKMVTLGDHVKAGSVLFHITNLERVWVMFDAYESDIPWVNKNDIIQFTVRSIPGKTFTGGVTFIDPVVNPVTRVAYVRMELDNPGELLKPDMFVSGKLKAKLPGVDLATMIPKSAVLWTGKRAITYVKVPGQEKPVFEYREVILGEDAGNFYVVKRGLEVGEEIATNGVFKIDAAAQLQGKASMMNPDAGQSSGADEEQDGKVITDISVSVVNPEFIDQLNQLFSSYLMMKDAFVASDGEKVRGAAVVVKELLTAIDAKLLIGEGRKKWIDFSEKLLASLDGIETNDDIEEQRGNFSSFVGSLYPCLKYFDVGGGKIYYQFCPMAFDDKGAYWLNDTKDIRNPYFGDMKLKCGSTISSF